MATTTTALVSVEEYLASSYEPECEFIDGVLRQKPMATGRHGRMVGDVGYLIRLRFPRFVTSPEVSVRINERMYLIPDVIAELRTHLQDPYPTEPVHLCVEIISPCQSLGEMIAKCGIYHAWGVPYTWIIDPENREAWMYESGSQPVHVPHDGSISAGEIVLTWQDLFA